MKKGRKKATEKEVQITADDLIGELKITAEDSISNMKITANEVVENISPAVVEITPVETIKTITAKIDCCFDNNIKNKFLTKDKEYNILNSTDVSFIIVNDQGVQHCFLYADAKDIFYI